MEVKTDPMLYDPVVKAQSFSSGLRDAPEERWPPRIPLDPKLYDAVVEGNLEVLNDFLQSQDLLLLDGVTIGDNTVLHIAASLNRNLTWQGTSDNVNFAREVYLRNRSLLTACNKLKETPLHCAAKETVEALLCSKDWFASIYKSFNLDQFRPFMPHS